MVNSGLKGLRAHSFDSIYCGEPSKNELENKLIIFIEFNTRLGVDVPKHD